MQKITLSIVSIPALKGLVFEDVGIADLNTMGTDTVSYIFYIKGER